MSNGIERLLRESNPPAGTLASPTPQYRNPNTGLPETVEGEHGAPFAKLLGPNGQPISSSNRLPVSAEVSGEVDVSSDPDRQLGKVTLTGQRVVDDEQLTVGETAVGLTPPPGATAAYITVEDGPIRYRIRGDNALPTIADGHKAEDGDDIVLSSADDIAAFRAIRSGSLDGILHVSYAEAVS